MCHYKDKFLAVGFCFCISVFLVACTEDISQTEVAVHKVEDSEGVKTENVPVETEISRLMEAEETEKNTEIETEIPTELTEEEKLEIKYEKFDYESYVRGDISGWTEQDYKTAQEAVEASIEGEAYQIWYLANGDMIDETRLCTIDAFAMDGREYGLLWYNWGSEDSSFGYYFLDAPDDVYNAKIRHGTDYYVIGVNDMFELYLESSESYFVNYTNDKKMAYDEELDAYYYEIYLQEQAAASHYTKEDIYARAQEDLKNEIYKDMNIFEMAGMMSSLTWSFDSSDRISYVYDSANRMHKLEFTVKISEYMGLGESIWQTVYMEYYEDENGGLTFSSFNRVE